MSNPITVLLVDDHEIVRRGVRAFLETCDEFVVVGEAESVRLQYLTEVFVSVLEDDR